MTTQEAIDNIQLDRMTGDITDKQADAAIEQLIGQEHCGYCGKRLKLCQFQCLIIQ